MSTKVLNVSFKFRDYELLHSKAMARSYDYAGVV